ncbi:hypothetical protein EST38_g6778 [Candolleomyces aberdarensis]|uniref:Tc1-like transposase DDE domain-containing protein n=1 Tax=Candolleomyces aberdarensis TaxID=2316362 RepID=A0A4Q2DIS9_9AGAR|nr:hypothetical protein EST38_g6778 [Candolleomyces aberdarensis]
MRNSIVQWKLKLNKDNSEIAALAGCSEHTVRKVLCIYNHFGIVNNPLAQQHGQKRALTMVDIDYIASVLNANPSLYMDEIQDQLLEYCNVEVSIPMLCQMLHQIALSHKKISKEAAERNQLLHATWQAEYGHIPADYFVWLDESAIDNQCTNGWSLVGLACVRHEFFVCSKWYSVLPAFMYEGYIVIDVVEGSINKEKFISFIYNEVAPLLNPYPAPKSVVVLNNCTIHHDEEIQRIVVEECGAKLVYLPPYSPDFNPIEQSFHSLKEWLRRNEHKAIHDDVQPYLVYQAAQSVTQDMAIGWIKNCGYTFSQDM